MQPPEKLSSRLKPLLTQIDQAEGCTFGHLITTAGAEGFGFLLGLLAIPGALPPGYSSPFGVLIFIVGWQLLRGQKTPTLPRWAMRLKIKKGICSKALGGALSLLSYLEKWSTPRWPALHKKGGRIWAGGIILLMGFLITLPIPFTHTIPAGVVLSIGLALSLRDGLLFSLAAILGSMVAAVYSGLAYALIIYGPETIIAAVAELR